MSEIKTFSSWERKAWGHQYIDRLVELGMTKTSIYNQLSKKMHYPIHRGHFGRTDNSGEINKMILLLCTMIERRETHMKELARKKTAIWQRIKERKAYEKLPWYKKILLKLFAPQPSKEVE